MPPKFLENIVILWFERRFSKQNSVIRLKSYILVTQNFLDPPKFLSWLRHWNCRQKVVNRAALQVFVVLDIANIDKISADL